LKAVYPGRYEREKWLRWWKWQYGSNPAGASLVRVAVHESSIVGHHSFIFTNMKVGNKILNGYQSTDAMTSPDYRCQGIATELFRHLFAEIDAVGDSVVFGFPNDKIYPVDLQTGWVDIGRMQTLLKPLQWRNAVKLKVKNRFLQRLSAIGGGLVFNRVLFKTRKPPIMEGLKINQVASFDDRINDFWTKVCNQHEIMVVRTDDYLNWRYRGPDVDYPIFVAEQAGEICGYVLLAYTVRKGVKGCNIFDMLAQSEQVMHCLVSKVIEDCQHRDVALITYRLIANRTYHRILKRNGFISLPFIKGEHFVAYSSCRSVSKDFLKNAKNWFVQIADSDLM